MCPGNAEVNIYRIVPHTRHLTGLSANTTQQPPSEVGVATDSIISLPKFSCEALTPNMMVFGDGTLG